MPRWDIPHIVKEPVEVDVRSFGVRMPPSTRENPNYGCLLYTSRLRLVSVRQVGGAAELIYEPAMG